jgi:hypothetical protein
VVVEGPTDLDYIRRLVELSLPTRRITVTGASGDVKTKINGIKEMLGGDLATSPYGSRLFAVVDSVHDASLKAALIEVGLAADRFVEWDRNGIEYVYPRAIMAEVYGCPPESVIEEVVIQDDDVAVRSVHHRKRELCRLVCDKLDSATGLPDEIHSKLLEPLRRAIDA